MDINFKILEDIVEKIKKSKNLEELNNKVNEIQNFKIDLFSQEEYEKILKIKNLEDYFFNIEREIKEHGDYQTPIFFVEKVLELINIEQFENIIEPTMGIGNFLISAIKKNKKINIYGVELQERYILLFKLRFLELIKNHSYKLEKINIFHDNIFFHEFKEIDFNKKTLIIGNPPWITNSKVGTFETKNLPPKINFKNLTGLDALTGKSNFDITEYILLKIIKEFSESKKKINVAVLCKTIVARNLLKLQEKERLPISNMKIYEIDAKKIFNVSCDACLFIFDIDINIKEDFIRVFNFENPHNEIKKIGWIRQKKFVSNIENYKILEKIDGKCELEWRQGVKHDCSKVMELKKIEKGKYINGFKEVIELENENIFSLLKSSDIKENIIQITRKKVIITQKEIGEETEKLKISSPKLWKYLQDKKENFKQRKSVIYKNKPEFSIFGIGEYSFGTYKIAVSGMYKKINFSLILPDESNKPILLDDTCYFISFYDFKEAVIIWGLLKSEYVSRFLESIVFLDAKRPYTKDILMRISLTELFYLIDYKKLIEILKNLELKNIEKIKIEDYEKLKMSIIKYKSYTLF